MDDCQVSWELFKKPNLLLNFNRFYLKREINSLDLGYNSTSHRLSHVLKGHLGCVNTLNWSQDGSLLLSGSDDQCLLIHQYTPANPLKRFELENRFQTAHINNIFDAKFAPGSQDKIVSVAADGRVCLIDDWSRRGWDELNSRTFVASLTHDARKLDFVDGNVFFVACGDGNVLQFDVRDSKPVNRQKIDLSAEQVGIHSISACPSAPNLLAVAGTDPFIRIYDIRSSLRVPTCDLWTPPLISDKKTNFCTGVRFSRFGYTLAANYIKDGPYLIDPIYQDKEACKLLLQQQQGNFGLQRELEIWNRIMCSYNSKNFLEAEKDLKSLIVQHRHLQNDPLWTDILAYEVFNRVLCLGQMSRETPNPKSSIEDDLLFVIKILDSWAAKHLLVMYNLSLGLIENVGVLCELFLSNSTTTTGSSDEWTTKLEAVQSIAAVCELDPAQITKLIPQNSFKQSCSEISFVNLSDQEQTQKLISGFNGYLARFPGVLHERTIKGISFVGDSDQFVGVGSDGGYAFLFKTPEKVNETCTLPVWAVKSDRSVVNVVEGHPFLPCIAVSGIDETIKIWEPEILNNSQIEDEDELPDDYKAFSTAEIPDLMQNLPNLQGINRLEFRLNPFIINSSDLVIYF